MQGIQVTIFIMVVHSEACEGPFMENVSCTVTLTHWYHKPSDSGPTNTTAVSVRSVIFSFFFTITVDFNKQLFMKWVFNLNYLPSHLLRGTYYFNICTIILNVVSDLVFGSSTQSTLSTLSKKKKKKRLTWIWYLLLPRSFCWKDRCKYSTSISGPASLSLQLVFVRRNEYF